MYPIVYSDTIPLKIRDEAAVKNLSVYLALGMRADSLKKVLALWIEFIEGAKFWMTVVNEPENRRLDHDPIAVVAGQRSFPGAIESMHPQAQIQTVSSSGT